ncbi:MAG: hypothetical protein FJY98_00520 [Candidatus Liptonbacteria bacterium]|nr:hypothetical protein [Candidatus Liptonbacteria bacterium]
MATTTFYPDPKNNIRSQLAYEMVQRASVLGYRMVVVDGGSPGWYREKFEKLQHVQVVEEISHPPGKLGPGRRQAMKVAGELAKNDPVVFFEPEKVGFVTCVETAAAPVLAGEADLVVPSRMPQGFVTYPKSKP